MKANTKSKLEGRNNVAMIEMLPTVAFAVIMLFAIAYIGTYLNGTIASALVDTYPNNNPSGNVDLTYWHNATVKDTNVSRNITLSCTAGELTGATTRWYILANGSAMDYNLTVNGNKVNNTSNLTSGKGFNWTLTALIAAGAVANSDTYLNFTWNLTAPGNRVYIRAIGTYFVSSDYRTTLQNKTTDTMGNLTTSYDSTLEIVIIAAIITVLTIPLMAIVAIKRLM